MPRRVFLIRHCQSEANRDERAEGRGDSPLTPLGLEQARRRAETLADHALEAVILVASPLQRAATTAAWIAEHHGWDLAHDHRLMEGDLGWFEGLSYKEVMTHIPEGATWAGAEVHGGEPLETVGARMQAALDAALTAAAGPVVMVSHGYAISALLHRLGHDAVYLANGDMVELHLDEATLVATPARHPLGG
jgi:probable phosphoglycerate mutase